MEGTGDSNMGMWGGKAPIERSAESVTPGHPDKICDQMADALVDMALAGGDGKCRMAAEVTGGHGKVFVTGECTVLGGLDEFQGRAGEEVRRVYGEVTGEELDDVTMHMVVQSPDIAQGVNRDDPDEQGAGDQGVMVGYATNETPEMLPLPFVLARRMTDLMYRIAMERKLPWAHTDGKSVVVMKEEKVIAGVVAWQHDDVAYEQMLEDVKRDVVVPVIGYVPEHFVFNGTGKFVQGGFAADAGTTGRKLIVDNYGPESSIGGGAYSGKDPSKVDRSAAYMARFIAKTAVAHGLGNRVLVQLAYVIGVAQPIGVLAVTEAGKDISQWVRDHFDLRPRAIIERLNLVRPIYRDVCVGGHYGLDHTVADDPRLDVWTWEQVANV